MKRPLSRDTPWLKTTLAACTIVVLGFIKTPQGRSAWSSLLPNKGIALLSPALAVPITKASELLAISPKQPDGSELPPNWVIRLLNMISRSFTLKAREYQLITSKEHAGCV